MVGWELGDVEALLVNLFQNDSTIKTKMGVTGGGKARVATGRVPRNPGWDVYIYFYFILGQDTRVQGPARVMSNPDVDIEVRTLGAPTDDSEAIVDRIDVLMQMKRTLTLNNRWLISVIPRKPINITAQGESTEVYNTRRGRTYGLQVVSALNQ